MPDELQERARCSVLVERTPHEILGVPTSATQAEIRSAYRRLARQLHPDIGGSAAVFALVREAYEELTNPERPSRSSRESSSHGPEPAAAQTEQSSPTAPPAGGMRGATTQARAAGSAQPHSRRRAGWLRPVASLAIGVAVWNLVFADTDEAPVTAADDEVTWAPPPEPTPPEPVERSTAAPPRIAGPSCADLAPVQVSYRLVSKEYYGLQQYWPEVSVTNQSAYPLVVSLSGWARVSNPYLPELTIGPSWAKHDLEVGKGATGSVVLGERTGDKIQLSEGEEILSIHLSGSVRMQNWSVDPGPCDVEVRPAEG